jgi:hypothetical protein
MKQSIKIILIGILFLQCSTVVTRASEKMITIDEYLASRYNQSDPYVNYTIFLRCSLVFKIKNQIAVKNNITDGQENTERAFNKFMSAMSEFALKSKMTVDKTGDDIKRYYKTYEELMMNNYALTGSYFSEPTYAKDHATCNALLK